MGDSNPPHDAKTTRLKSIATIVASLAALVTALGAYFKPQDHSVNKASYEELTKVLKELSEQSDKDHDDIIELRGYVEGMVAGKSPPVTTTIAPSASVGVAPVLSAIPVPSASGVAGKAAIAPAVVVIREPRAVAKTAVQTPRDFESVMQQAKK